MKTERVKLNGHVGTWYLIGKYKPYNHKTLYLWESELYGDDASHIITDSKLNIIDDDWYDSLEQYVIDCL